MDKMDSALSGLTDRLGDDLEITDDAFFTCLRVTPAALTGLMQELRDQMGMNYLADLTAVDYKEEFEVVYHLYAIPDNGRKLVVKTRVVRDKAELPSMIDLYPTVDWQEREAYDLMGISFSGHPNLIRVLLPDDFEGHPLRKDFRKGS